MRDDLETQSTGFADFIGDAALFLMCVAIALGVGYLAVILLRPDVWRWL